MSISIKVTFVSLLMILTSIVQADISEPATLPGTYFGNVTGYHFGDDCHIRPDRVQIERIGIEVTFDFNDEGITRISFTNNGSLVSTQIDGNVDPSSGDLEGTFVRSAPGFGSDGRAGDITGNLTAEGVLTFIENSTTPGVSGCHAFREGVFQKIKDDNCPNDFNPEQLDTDDDSKGDVCDPDDDNDFVNDTQDNCPLHANTSQDDSDYDGLGDVCDESSDDNENVVLAVESITNANLPGGNGLINKLIGVLKKVNNAVSAYDMGLIDLNTYSSELDHALDKLTALENQVEAKIRNGQVDGSVETNIRNAISDTREKINNLLI